MNIKDLLAKQIQENHESHERSYIETIDEDPLQVILLPVSKIEENPFQPRSIFDEEAIQSLANSIKAEGLLQHDHSYMPI